MTRVEDILDWPDRLNAALEGLACSREELLRCLDLHEDGGWLQAAIDSRVVPTMSQLAELSACTGVPLTALVSHQPMGRRLSVALRSGLAVVPEDMSAVVDRAPAVLADRGLLLSWYADERVRVDQALTDARRSVSQDTFVRRAAIDTAERLRDILDLRDEPIADLTPIVEGLGVPVLLERLPTNLQGLTIRDDTESDRPGVMFVNCNDWWGRQRYTLAHELGHLLFNDSGQLFMESKHVEEANRTEFRCEIFARHFLAPRNAVRKFGEQHFFGGTTAVGGALARFMMEFGVSKQVAMNIFHEDLKVNDTALDPYRSVRIEQLMQIAGLGNEWYEACRIQDEPSASPWLVRLTLDAFTNGLVDTSVVARVLGRPDTDVVGQELVEMGWGAPG